MASIRCWVVVCFLLVLPVTSGLDRFLLPKHDDVIPDNFIVTLKAGVNDVRIKRVTDYVKQIAGLTLQVIMYFDYTVQQI